MNKYALLNQIYICPIGADGIQVEANRMHHLANYWQQQYNFPVLTVYDEFIVPEEHYPMVKEFMFTTSTACEVCDHYSLMDQIKKL